MYWKIILSGIYKIQSKCKPDRIYIGSAVNIYNRWSVHRCDLRKRKHSSSAFQRHVDKYGLDDLEFSVIAICDTNELNPINKVVWLEQCFIWAYRHEGMNRPFFNASPMAGSCKGIKHPKEYGEAISARQKGRPGWRNGCHNTPEHNAKISKAHMGMVNWEGVRKASITNTGRKQSKETIEKRRKTMEKVLERKRQEKLLKKTINQLSLPL
jgi:group I intron endonuclease